MPTKSVATEPKTIPLTMELNLSKIENAVLRIFKDILEDKGHYRWELEKLLLDDKEMRSMIKGLIERVLSSDKIQAKLTVMIESQMDGIISRVVSRQIEKMTDEIKVPKEEMARIMREALSPQPAKPKAQPKKAEETPQQPQDEA